MASLVDNDRFAKECGVRLLPSENDCFCAEMAVTDRHLNGAGVCQGGALFTLADLAMAAAVNHNKTSLQDEGIGLSVNTQISFLQPALSGDKLIATCRLIKEGRLPLLETTITSQNGQTIAILTGQFYRLSAKK